MLPAVAGPLTFVPVENTKTQKTDSVMRNPLQWFCCKRACGCLWGLLRMLNATNVVFVLAADLRPRKHHRAGTDFGIYESVRRKGNSKRLACFAQFVCK